MSPMTPSPALWAFLLMAVWVGLGFVGALLCAAAALAAEIAVRALRGEPVLADLRERAEAARSGFASPPRVH